MRIESFPPGETRAEVERPAPRRRRRMVSVLTLGLVAGALVAGVSGGIGLSANSTDSSPDAPAAAAPEPAAPPPDPNTCTPLVAAMSPRDRVAQRLMIGVDPADPASAVATVRDSHVGGIFIGGNPTAVFENDALAAVQQASPTEVAVAVDDEGGRVQRIDALVGDLPSARQMAQQTPEQVRALAEERGKQLLERGVNWNLAPTVDVSDQPRNDVIGDRSFSNDPAVVTRYAQAWEDGQRAAGVYGVLKHFPGHGHSSGDSHKGRVSVPPLDQLRQDDLKPYADLLGSLDQEKVGVMVGHLDVPGLTDSLPSSLTPAVYQLLRGEFGFDGMVMTDDLGAMKAISGSFTPAQASLAALQAGADMALVSNVEPAGPILDTIEQANLPDTEVAAERILAAKGLCTRGG
jgi:beta-N-acetylhexosaminidase